MKTLVKSNLILFALIVLSAVPLRLTAQPSIQVNANELYFGNLPYAQGYTATMFIFNQGDQPLEVTGITFSSDDFAAFPEALIVNPFGTGPVEVIFTPSLAGIYQETVTVFSNDPQNPVIELPIYANLQLPKPDYLSVHVDESDISLTWGASGDEGSWINYDTGDLLSAAGIAEPGVFHIAARWPAESLTAFAGNQITRFLYFPMGEYSLYTIKIWKGENASQLIYSQPVYGDPPMQWSEVMLDNPVNIESDQEYWIGLEINQVASYDFGAAFDTGPGEIGLGDMINLGGEWISISQYGFSSNWFIRAFVEDSPETIVPNNIIQSEIAQSGQLAELVRSNVDFSEIGAFFTPESIEELLGYNLYRDGVKLNNDPLNVAIYVDGNLQAGIYNYAVTAVYPEGESEPAERTAQVGGPKLIINPTIITATVQGGEIFETTISLTNTGVSPLEWNVTNFPQWISFSVSGATIGAGGSLTTTMSVNTLGLPNGTHPSNIKFNTNDFNNPQTFLPVIITVEGQLPATFDVDALDFGMTPVLESKIEVANITNQTDALLMFLSFTTTLTNYAAYPSTWAIQPGQSMEVSVVFSPSSVNTFSDTLYVEWFGYSGTGILKLPITGQGIALPPSNLTAEVDNSMVTLNWFAPGASSDELRFGNGQPYSAIGTSSGTYEFAARFTPSDLMPYNGKQLEKVGFYPHSNNAIFSLRVYTGINAEVMLINLPLSNISAYQWNDIELPFPISLNEVDYLWIGYETQQTELVFIAGVDGGPGVNGSGDLIRINGNDWMTLGANGWSYNWNIRGILGNDLNAEVLPAGGSILLPETVNLLGYNIYRDGEKLNEELLPETTFTDEIEEGVTYLYGVTAVFEYGESIPAEVIVAVPAMLVMPGGWEFTTTNRAHVIQIPITAIQPGLELNAGDMIGVFYIEGTTEKCAGAILWGDQNAVLIAYGDDPETLWKEGFLQDESISWKVFFNQSQTSYPLTVTYSSQMPHHDGSFKMMGLSMLETIELGTTSVGEFAGLQSATLFPNPSNANVTLSGLNSGERITVFDINGRTMLTFLSHSKTMQFNIEEAGLYIVEIQGKQEVIRKKLIIR
ncbi:MAG: choice-of-anchor D domain-containing protein [Bacteroidales bacterium]|nr:choice-of-anchor D domain-containing protein [Bacteroidales bacterium]